ncbi:TMEM175 family protein [Luteimonas aquatica]|uniref:TMEM175 family protein n=1 Tax=Luteimonas aquatica TaxID=450364 RepID=UPI001F57DBFA|nr:TMEM175 family protein [Luteimonas aquatica]
MRDLGVVEDEKGEPVGQDRFPHDRVVFFSDAVFAIAITLLAIELRLPDEELIERVGAQAANSETVSLFISYFISFLVTGLFWAGHMQTWKYVRHVNGKLVWSTLLQLMFVALMPFATREYSASFSGDNSARFAFYAFVLTAISFFSLLTRRIVVRQENLRERLGEAQVRWLLWRGVVPLVLFALSIPLAFVLPVWSAGLVFFMIFPLSAIAKRAIGRAKPETDVGE